jgi:hypothetical protein
MSRGQAVGQLAYVWAQGNQITGSRVMLTTFDAKTGKERTTQRILANSQSAGGPIGIAAAGGGKSKSLLYVDQANGLTHPFDTKYVMPWPKA